MSQIISFIIEGISLTVDPNLLTFSACSHTHIVFESFYNISDLSAQFCVDAGLSQNATISLFISRPL
jgi:hypothetical protein